MPVVVVVSPLSVNAVALARVLVREPVVARVLRDDHVAHQRDLHAAAVERAIVERNFAARAVPSLTIATLRCQSNSMCRLSSPFRLPSSDQNSIGRIRPSTRRKWLRSTTGFGLASFQEPFGEGVRREFVGVARRVVGHLELARAETLALVFDFVNGGVGRDRRICRRRAAARGEGHEARGGVLHPTLRSLASRIHASPSKITGFGSGLPSSMTAPRSSLKRPVANQSTARGRIMCSPV